MKFLTWRGAVIAFALVMLLGGGIIWAVDPWGWLRPSDEELIVLFNKHERSFELLRSLALQDMGRKSIVNRETIGCDDVKDNHDQEYCDQINEIRRDLSIGIDSFRISFFYSTGGITIGHSWMKGIAYLPHGSARVGPVLDSLDDLGSVDGVYLRRIRGNWFVVYSSLD